MSETHGTVLLQEGECRRGIFKEANQTGAARTGVLQFWLSLFLQPKALCQSFAVLRHMMLSCVVLSCTSTALG